MAYLKGGSVVDGNLYVEGSLKVKSVTEIEGNQFPVVESDNGTENRIVKFKGSEAHQIDARLKETETDDTHTVTYEVINADSVEFTNEISTLTVGYGNKLKGFSEDHSIVDTFTESLESNIKKGDEKDDKTFEWKTDINPIKYWSYGNSSEETSNS